MTDAGTPILLYDGSCGLCTAGVRFILNHERRHSLRFAPLQSFFGTAFLRRYPHVSGEYTMVWYEPASADKSEELYFRSAAALKIASYMGGPWRLLGAAALLPKVLRDALYRLVARHRHRFSRPVPLCHLPDAGARERFMNIQLESQRANGAWDRPV